MTVQTDERVKLSNLTSSETKYRIKSN